MLCSISWTRVPDITSNILLDTLPRNQLPSARMTNTLFEKQFKPCLRVWRVAYSEVLRRPDSIVHAECAVVTDSGDLLFYMSVFSGSASAKIPLYAVARGDWETVSLADPGTFQSIAVSSALSSAVV